MSEGKPTEPEVQPAKWIMVHSIGWFAMLGNRRECGDSIWTACRDLSVQIDWKQLEQGEPITQIGVMVTYAQSVEDDVPEFIVHKDKKPWPTFTMFALQPVAMEMGPVDHASDVVHRAVAVLGQIASRWKIDASVFDRVELPPKPSKTAFFGKPRKR